MEKRPPKNVLPFRLTGHSTQPAATDRVHKLDGQLRFAIDNRRLLKIRYGEKSRIVEPHDYGVKNGSRKLLAYQIDGASSRQNKGANGWKMLDIEKIEACSVLRKTFAGSRVEANQQHLAWDELFIRVD